MKVLVVEDDPNVAQTIQYLLSDYRYAVDLVADAETGWQMVEAFDYDLALIDIRLPGMDGLSLCQDLRQAGYHMPILLLTGQSSAGPQKAAALNVGADDYMAKPFDGDELMARVQALLRRSGADLRPVLTWGTLAVDPSRRRVTYGTTLLSPTPKEYAILELLLRHSQVTLNATEILNRVWDSAESPGEEVVRYHIKELRQKLLSAGAPKNFIQTLHGVGYRLNPLYSEALAKQVEQAPELPQVAELTSVNEQLRATLEALQSKSEELRIQNEALQATRSELEQERQWYRDLFENAPDSYLITDAEGLIQSANGVAADSFGMAASALVGQPFVNFVHPDDRYQFRTCLSRQRWPQNWEIRIQPDSHAVFPALMTVIPTRDDHQHVCEIRWMLRNISDRKHLQQQLLDSYADLEQRVQERTAALHEREAFLRGIYNGAAQAIFVVNVTADGDFRFVDFNSAALDLSGRRLEDIQGQTPEAVFGEQIGGNFRQHYQDCIEAGHPIAYEEEIVLSDRTLCTITTLSPIRNAEGRIDRLVGTVMDLSDRKQLELALRTSEAKLSRIFDSAVAAISEFYVYPDRTYANQFMSPGCESVYGYSHQKMLADNDLWALRVLPEDMETVIAEALDRILAEATFTIEYRFLDPDEQIRWIAETLISHRDEVHDRWVVTTVAVNISDRKQAEMALQQQIRQEYLLADIAQDIRQSLNIEEVLSRTVHRVRDFLATDRVIILRFRPNWQGDVIEESVGPEWLSIIGLTIYDPCFKEQYTETYRQGHVTTVTDIDQDTLEPCYVELLKPLQVRSNLVVPILQGEALWGLLIAHHCAAPRQWQPGEMAMLRRLAVQVGIAIQQSELFEQTRRELLARQHMQAVLEESEERYRTLSAAAPVGIVQTNADGICLYTNDYWHTLSGLSFEDSLGDGWQQAIHPDDRDRIRDVWEAHLRHHQECQTECRLVTAQGQMGWATVRAAVIQSAGDDTIGHVCILTDITAQKQAAQKIEEQAALLDIAPDAIFVCDMDDHILYWNQGAENLYGWTAAEAQGQKAHQLLQEDCQQIEAIMATLREQGDWQGEMAKVTKTGETGVVASRWTLVRDDAGAPKFVLNVNTDITRQKNLEAQFRQAQKLESLGQLASGIAHDLNNVFTPILTVSQLLRSKPRMVDEQSQQLLALLEKSARRGVNMVKQILSVTRRDRGEWEILNPAEIVEEVVKIAQQSLPTSIEIDCDIAPLAMDDRAGPRVFADPTQLHQILMNLVVNARDAMPEGGQLTLSADVTQVDAVLAEQTLDARIGQYCKITVADTGTGIPPELRDRIFDPFFTTKEPGKGTGLGLATVMSLVKEARGFLQVESELGSGTRVRLFLPMVSERDTEPVTLATSPEPTIAAAPADQGDYILVVDDDEMVRQTTQSLLVDHQYAPLVAQSGPAAIALYEHYRDRIRLVILDITMPQMSGIEVIERLRANHGAVRIIAISGLLTNREPAIAAGANVFLSKPYAIETLLAEVETLMR